MFQPRDIVLVDTNVILEAHRVKCWKQIANYFHLHTVGKVIEETQTGYQNRREEQTIDYQLLKKSFAHIEEIPEQLLVEFELHNNGDCGLHAGEMSLIIYAHGYKGNIWFLNSPDKATVNYACTQGWKDRLISLEAMTKHLNLKLSVGLHQNYTDTWLSQQKLFFLQNISNNK
ncbi:hypothetical protein [Methylotenera sp. 1P/1]|uniref:hypothetical protein n=1 Tax=Methylotenera sp. 1P/1 TaxID=1131551 RepID=UPI0003787839|nr:hypothetical protein [Methylotenera sp. 1P/1]